MLRRAENGYIRSDVEILRVKSYLRVENGLAVLDEADISYTSFFTKTRKDKSRRQSSSAFSC